MKLSDNFNLEEFTASTTADRLKIVNTLTGKAIVHIQLLVKALLQPLRTAYGQPMQVNSGYRCPELNRAVGGVATSQHTRGEASDIACASPRELLEVLKRSDLDFDQAILYPTFLHLSYTGERKNRRQIIIK